MTSPLSQASNLSVPTISLSPSGGRTSPNMEKPQLFENRPPSGGEVVQLGGAKLTRERKRTRELMKSLPKGIAIGERRDGRPKPYYVRHGKDRTVESFANEVDRNNLAVKLAVAVVEHGTSILNFDPAEWREFQAWKAGRKASMLIKDAAPKYVALRLQEDLIKDSDHHTHVELHMKALVDRFGLREVNGGVTTDELREWFPSIISARTKTTISKVTQRSYRKDVNMFFNRAVDEEWATKNPCRMVKPPRVEDEDKIPLKPKEIFDLLHHNLTEPVIGKITLELFGGMRASSAGRLAEGEINWAEKGIAMPGAKHKSTRRKFRQGHPSVLWAWMERAPKEAWTIKQKNYNRLKSLAFVRARVVNPGNVLRDSFASYLLALTKNFETVGYLMQHRNRRTTEVYEGIATEADAKLVMAMTPAAVAGTWEQFVAAQNTSPSKP